MLDDGSARNASAHAVHNYLTRDGVPPAELLAAGRREAERYGSAILRAEATAARSLGDGFEVATADGEVVGARRLLVATGLADELPAVPGVRELWGSQVVHCPYCHGWEIAARLPVSWAAGPWPSTRLSCSGNTPTWRSSFTRHPRLLRTRPSNWPPAASASSPAWSSDWRSAADGWPACACRTAGS